MPPLIASGSRNLGGTCARNVVERGGKVVLCDSVSMKDAGEELQQSLGQKDFMFVPTDTNVTSVFNVCRLSAELMAKNSPDSNGQRGVIINKSHRLAFNSSLAPYSMSQAAIIGMTLPMARDFKDLGVRVNSIATGFYRYQIPFMKGAQFQKFLSMMAFPYSLGSEDTFYHLCEKIVTNPYMNGEVVKLDGAVNTSFF
uniref:3-hydroxyacyl-CoA dehydrogenase type-2 n=1 Tax=Magallana gigas TaxID=29159 RepID=K1PDG2_MAGGI